MYASFFRRVGLTRYAVPGEPLTPEQLALARVLMEKGREALIDQGFNRYTTNDQGGLPTWYSPHPPSPRARGFVGSVLS
jgi:hypothetical protein